MEDLGVILLFRIHVFLSVFFFPPFNCLKVSIFVYSLTIVFTCFD